ncbi:bifunctional phosphopantothenoylcysteine decarboxylase/phosphopantothenate--cysteine ligase CoaBC [Ferrimonas balearica]|uniref:bifunctional phosphopantothenoylcysteine decarboxylase/phosphopantothenate--cysteine ligase CoaBC n=1 Tax=Ferrimonas balearica TaxID=44012 RepID=UPI001C996675|nr:bifunctional phosphopantothenoylcysteine decarboxylase/phosphopantothenate--cysteine ligase CoaBC [Ferrimonas balearica]MBY5923335.1 bifunctional phosphopantothenoylcysteine decarboxylase/phosphopantothenate--cysteine ligase CoaBC [Ferrimonas balearica]MBY5995293.1 bifunctional phosphopantothenoylcysteine decarboxylase/phosphopantothenate--cysteine ligase CoaBC [Ferrimonas balearica]
MSLSNRNILLGISGGIAAYKAPILVRRLREQGANVRVILTKGAKAFVTPMSLQAVSGHPVVDDILDPATESAMGHIDLARWADAVIVAPASANLIARLAAGMADDLLTTACLATTAPVYLAPAMNQQMYLHAATQANLETVARRGVTLWGPDSGDQACGEVGPGRMWEPEAIVEATVAALNDGPKPLAGKKLLLTAGPTREALDPVRFLSNHSSGKMGFALAEQATALGAEVTLVSGPVNLATPSGVTRIDVESAEQMLEAVLNALPGQDIFIGCAAVADYRPVAVADNKIKKSNERMVVELVRNPDILATVAQQQPRPFTVGFAAETDNVEQYARDKLARKGLDLIAANDVSKPDQGFNANHNALTLYWADGQKSLGHSDKGQQARLMLDTIADHLACR